MTNGGQDIADTATVQTRESGAEAARFGMRAAEQVASLLGAGERQSAANLFLLENSIVLIKTTRRGNGNFQVLNSTFKPAARLFFAILPPKEEVEIYELSPAQFLTQSNPSSTAGRAETARTITVSNVRAVGKLVRRVSSL